MMSLALVLLLGCPWVVSWSLVRLKLFPSASLSVPALRFLSAREVRGYLSPLEVRRASLSREKSEICCPLFALRVQGVVW